MPPKLLVGKTPFILYIEIKDNTRENAAPLLNYDAATTMTRQSTKPEHLELNKEQRREIFESQEFQSFLKKAALVTKRAIVLDYSLATEIFEAPLVSYLGNLRQFRLVKKRM